MADSALHRAGSAPPWADGGPATAAQIESAIAATDVVVTTRLHGLVLVLKNGVPALAVDPVAGGAKVAGQAAAWDWPVLLPPAGDPALDRAALDALWAWCRSPEAVTRARSALAAPSGPPLTADLLGGLRAALAEHG
jgi:hypothetical protein